MSDISPNPEPTVLVLAACQAPGADIARAFAERGARVILLDADSKTLTRIAAQNPDQIETLTITHCRSELARLLADIWKAEPLCMVVNLMPLEQPGAITPQMRNLVAVFRGLMRGMVAGHGALVSLVLRPTDPLALVGHGMLAAMKAGSAALGQAVAAHGVRVHVLSIPAEAPEIAVETLLMLSTKDAEQIASTSFDLG